jgi:hypothetical protein
MIDGKVLIVRHGKGRGRHRNYMAEALKRLYRLRPALFRRLVLHHTGEAAPPLDGVAVVVFWLADPLREWYPDCYADAVDLAEAARALGLRIINPPESLSNGIKSVQARLWAKAGIATPPVERFSCRADLVAAVERLCFPLLVRGDEWHGQKGARVFSGADELLHADAAEMVFPCAIAPLVDVRSDYREKDPFSPFAGLFHKKRLIVANGAVRTKHTFFADTPIVSAASSLFGRPRRWLQGLFPPYLSPLERTCVAIDLAYWEQREEHKLLMNRACTALGFDFAAVDYSNRADGTPVLWEANPYFILPRLDEMRLPRLRRAVERVDSYHDAIGDFLASLLTKKP